MKTGQNTRTVRDILHYLRDHAVDGRISKSMMTMAKETGYSNATIHRSIRALEKQGVIQTIQSSNIRQPNTILYFGPKKEDVHTLLAEAHTALHNLMCASDEVHKVLKQVAEVIDTIESSDKGLHFG